QSQQRQKASSPVQLRDDVFMSREQSGHRRAADESRDPVRTRRSEYQADPRDDDSLDEAEQRAGEENQRRQRNTKRRHDRETDDVQWPDPRHAMQAVHEAAKAPVREQPEVAKPPGHEARGAKEQDEDGDSDEERSAEPVAVVGRSVFGRRRRHSGLQSKACARRTEELARRGSPCSAMWSHTSFSPK